MGDGNAAAANRVEPLATMCLRRASDSDPPVFAVVTPGFKRKHRRHIDEHRADRAGVVRSNAASSLCDCASQRRLSLIGERIVTHASR